MAIPIWPTSLPQKPLFDGYREAIPNNVLRSESDAGFSKTRRKGATPPFRIEVSFNLTGAQRTTLYNFVSNTLLDGTLRFELAHFVDGNAVEMRIVGSGDDLVSITPYGLEWLASMKLEVLP